MYYAADSAHVYNLSSTVFNDDTTCTILAQEGGIEFQ